MNTDYVAKTACEDMRELLSEFVSNIDIERFAVGESYDRDTLAAMLAETDHAKLAGLAADYVIAMFCMLGNMQKHEEIKQRFAAEDAVLAAEMHELDAKIIPAEKALLIYMAQVEGRSAVAKKGGIAKNARDPKQVAKAAAHELWQEWKTGRHTKIKTTEDFARAVMTRWPVLTSAKVICAWSAGWNREAKSVRSKDPAC